jgi:hypothetical protein
LQKFFNMFHLKRQPMSCWNDFALNSVESNTYLRYIGTSVQSCSRGSWVWISPRCKKILTWTKYVQTVFDELINYPSTCTRNLRKRGNSLFVWHDYIHTWRNFEESGITFPISINNLRSNLPSITVIQYTKIKRIWKPFYVKNIW